MQPKVGAYITCYKDEISASRCIKAIESQSIQVSPIYIVDNSNHPLLLKSHYIQLIVHHYPDNIGIGKGIVKALEWFIEQKYDFLWTFDQDSIPNPNCLKTLLSTYNQLSKQDNYQVGIVAPTPIDSRTNKVVTGAAFSKYRFIGLKHDSNVDIYECDAPITSGSLIPLSVAKSVAYPNSDLFIDGVDFDYGLRIKQTGFHNIIATKAIMHHNFGTPSQVKFMGQTIYVQQYSALRYYYICRNHTYLEMKHSQGCYKFASLIQRFKSMLIKIVLIILYNPNNKLLKIWACLIGTYHGLISKLGKTWQ